LSQPEVEQPGIPPGADDLEIDVAPSTAFDGVVSVVGAEDVVRYLRQRDDVVVQTADGAFLVNGRFRETLEELVERANRIRARQCLPRFVTLPPQTAMPAGKSAEGAPMNGYRSI
jgi:hypothetical protein